MELNNNCGVYLIVSPSNGRYVGSSKSLKKRFNRYKNYSCSKQSAILASLKKYGYENHKIKILMYCEESELLFWERVFGDIYLASTNFKNGLTITLPGYNDVPQVRSEDFKKRVSKTQKKRFEKKKEREKTSKTTKNALSKIKDKISIAQKKRYECQEQRDIRSKTRIEYYKNNPEVIMKMSEDTKKRMKNNQELKERCLSGFKKYYEENPNIRSERMKKWHKENPKN
jgi:group I intron endonuclease